MGWKTIAQIIGESDDPKIEAVRSLFYHECARLEQLDAQRNPPTPIERRREEWNAAKRIIAKVEEFER